MENLWEEIKNKCLENAMRLLEKKTALTEKNIKAVKGLVDVVIAMEGISYLQKQQTRYGAAVFQDQSFSQREEGN